METVSTPPPSSPPPSSPEASLPPHWLRVEDHDPFLVRLDGYYLYNVDGGLEPREIAGETLIIVGVPGWSVRLPITRAGRPLGLPPVFMRLSAQTEEEALAEVDRRWPPPSWVSDPEVTRLLSSWSARA